MLRAKKILFPTDFSPSSDAALAAACLWARRLEAEFHLVHVVETFRPDVFATASVGADPKLGSMSLQQHASAEIGVRRRLAISHGVTATSGLAQGLAAAPAILDYAENLDVDLIIMSTHGRRGVRRLLLGSVAEEVVQRSTCPVLTVAAALKSSTSLPPRRILVAADLSDHSPALVAHGKEFAALFGAELQLLHVVVRPSLPAYYDGAGLPNLVFESPLLEREVQSALEALYAAAGGPAGPCSIHIEHGVAAEQIVRFAAVNSSELAMVASHGLTGVSHLLMGSVSERAVREAHCPVLTVKSFGRSLVAKPAVAAAQASDREPNGGARRALQYRPS